ncbi:Nanchung [Aphelenchoides bicaudatus]|nr:Nanchung [Aphelenchoides bicaudatus]
MEIVDVGDPKIDPSVILWHLYYVYDTLLEKRKEREGNGNPYSELKTSQSFKSVDIVLSVLSFFLFKFYMRRFGRQNGNSAENGHAAPCFGPQTYQQSQQTDRNEQRNGKPGVDQPVGSNSTDKHYPIYNLVDMHGGGELIPWMRYALNSGDYSLIDLN